MAEERILRLGVDPRPGEAGFKRFRAAAKETSTASDVVARSVRDITTAFAGFFTARHVLSVAQDFGQLQTAMAEVSTLMSDTSGIENMTAAVEDLSAAFGRGTVEQAKALYQVISAGATDAAQALELLETANRLATGGITSVETAADGLTSILNAYGAAVGSAESVSDALFVAMKAGKTTISELAGSIGQVAPLAAQAGVSLEEVLSATSALTKGGQATTEAMRGIRQIIAAIVKPTVEASKMASELGVQFDAAALRAQGLSGFLQNLTEATGGSTEQMAQLFGGVEALVPVLALTGSGSRDFAETLDAMGDRAGATGEAFAKMADTMEVRIARIREQFAAFERSLISGAVPAVEAVTDNIDTLVDAATVLAAAYGGRVLTGIATATEAKVTAAAAARALAAAEVTEAQAAHASAVAAQRAAQAQASMAQSMVANRAGMIAQAEAARALGAANIQVATTSARVATAQAAVTASTVTLGGALRGLVAFLGGPLGIALIAAAGGWALYRKRVREAEEASREFADELDELRRKYSDATAEEARNAAAATQAAALRKQATVEEIESQLRLLEIQRRGSDPSTRRELNREIENTRDALDGEREALERLEALAQGAIDRVQALATSESTAALEAKRIREEMEGVAAATERAAAAAERMERAKKNRETASGIFDSVQATETYRSGPVRDILAAGSRLGAQWEEQAAAAELARKTSAEFRDTTLQLEQAQRDLDDAETTRLSKLDTVLSGTVALVDGLGLLDENTRAATRGVADFVTGLNALREADSLASGVAGVAGMVGGALSLLGGMFSDEDAQRIRDATRQFNNALNDYVGELTDPTRWEQLQGQALDDAKGVLNEFVAAAFSGLPDKIRDDVIGDVQDAITNLDTTNLEELLGKLGPEGAAILEKYRDVLAQIEEQRQASIQSMSDSLAVETLRLQGRDAEAAALQLQITYQTRLAEAIALGSAELQGAVESWYEVATAAAEAAEANRIAAEEERKRSQNFDFMSNLGIMQAENAGDEELAATLRAQAEAARDIANARKLLEEGVIDQAAFDAFVEAVGTRMKNAIEDATQAAEEAARAQQFRADQDLRNLQVQLLTAQGRDKESLLLRQQIELLDAIENERSAEYIATLKQLHAQQLANFETANQTRAMQDQARATRDAKEAAEGLARVFNAPRGVIAALYKAQTIREGARIDPFGVGGSSPSFGPNLGSGSSSVQIQPGAIVVHAAPGMDPKAVAQEVVNEARNIVRAGGANPFNLVTA